MITIVDENGVTTGSVDSIGNVSQGKLTIAGSAAPPPQGSISHVTWTGGSSIPPGAFQRMNWLVNPADANDQAATIAYVDVYQNDTFVKGEPLAHSTPADNSHTAVYRQGGAPVPQVFTNSAVCRVGGVVVGPLNMVLKGYDDNGNLIATVNLNIPVG